MSNPDETRDRVNQQPSGYQHAWSNPLGAYVVSDDPNFNPNVGSKRSWQALEPARR